MAPFLLAAIVVSTAFDGGNVGRVEQVAPNHIRCNVQGQADQNNRNRQASWYYFQLDKLPRTEVRVELGDLVGEYNFRPGAHAVTKNSRPVYSYDQRTWTHFTSDQVSWEENPMRLTVRFKPAKSRMWIAHTPPYTKVHLDRLLAVRHPHAKQSVVGRTLLGRDIPMLTITDPSVPEKDKRVIWLMARQHAWESGTSWVADGAVRFLLSNDADAARIRRENVFLVIPVFDIDGTARGMVRFNGNGFDNNRNWDTADEKTMPEIFTIRRSVLDWIAAGHRVDILYAMHNTESTDYVEGPTTDAAMKPLCDEIVKRLSASSSFIDARSPRNLVPGTIDKGRQTIAQYFYLEHKLPAFLMEWRVEDHPTLKRPRTVEDNLRDGAGLVRALAR